MIKINGKLTSVSNFPDGTPLFKLDSALKNNQQINITWLFDSMSELFILQCIADFYKGCNLFLEMPYIPNARMDRVKNPDEVFTLKSFAKMINAMGFKAVVVDNAHSDVSRALIENIQDDGLLHINCFLSNRVISNKEINVDTIMFPDAGACKRYSELSIVKDCFEIVVGEKTRDWRSGKILGLEIKGKPEAIKDKNILIIDDICSKGGTFKYSAIELKKLGAKNIYLYISHCENVIDIEALKEAGITKVFTTNSIYRGTNDFVEVC